MARNYAKCTCCGNSFPVVNMVGTEMPNRGSRHAYMCNDCATRNRHYHTSNTEIQGTINKDRVQVGWELETSFSDDYARNILFEYGMIPTRDGSLRGARTCEYVSGIQQGLNIGSKMCVTIETLMSGGHLEINESCGTHFHVSVNNMENTNGEKVYMDYIRRYYHSLFVPLCEEMQRNPEKTKNLFGRYFTDHYDEYGDYRRGYAAMVNYSSNENDRYNFINVTNNSNIEFRLNRFVSAKQSQTVTKMEVEMVKCIVENFCKHFNTPYSEIDARRYYMVKNGQRMPSKDAYRKHKARVTGNKLVKIFQKYSNL